MSSNEKEPSSTELVAALREQAAKHPDVTELGATEGSALLEALATRFVNDSSRRWWWESLKTPGDIIPYGELEMDGMSVLASRISGSPIYLIISDDDFPPWTIFKGDTRSILEMIGEVWFFEYAIANESLSWLAFDTHHNVLVICQ